jgi:hypothetical protein
MGLWEEFVDWHNVGLAKSYQRTEFLRYNCEVCNILSSGKDCPDEPEDYCQVGLPNMNIFDYASADILTNEELLASAITSFMKEG